MCIKLVLCQKLCEKMTGKTPQVANTSANVMIRTAGGRFRDLITRVLLMAHGMIDGITLALAFVVLRFAAGEDLDCRVAVDIELFGCVRSRKQAPVAAPRVACTQLQSTRAHHPHQRMSICKLTKLLFGLGVDSCNLDVVPAPRACGERLSNHKRQRERAAAAVVAAAAVAGGFVVVVVVVVVVVGGGGGDGGGGGGGSSSYSLTRLASPRLCRTLVPVLCSARTMARRTRPANE